MKFKILTGILILSTLLAACQSTQPPTMLVMEVTRVVTVVVAPEDITDTAVAEASSDNPTRTPLDSETPLATTEADATATPDVTPTPDVFPTAVVGEIFLASQTFERGDMYWVQPVNQIWVTTTDVDGTKVWRVYEDTFEEGMPESDPELEAPEGLFQPIRGFGKLWRDNPELRTDLGWATDNEIGYNTRYEYLAGGEVTEDFEYIPAPGFHVIELRDGTTLRFDEEDRTWDIE